MLLRKKYKYYFLGKMLDLYLLFYSKYIQKVKLKDILKYCSDNIEAYKDIGIDIEEYPYIDKSIIIEKFSLLANQKKRFKSSASTSGSTGTPTKFFRDIRSIAAEHYFQNKYFGWKKKYMIIFRGENFIKPGISTEVMYKKIPFIRKMYVSSYHINDITLTNLVSRLSSIPDKCLWAYPSSAYLLAEYCIRNGSKLNFDVVATSSETLTDLQAETIEKAFNCRLKDWYGQAERVAALCRCEYGHYHEPEGYSHVEYINDGSGTFEIVGTTLHNKVMPLIRLKTGDLIEIGEGSCKCGNTHGPDIKRIVGRRSSYIELPEYRIPECVVGCLLKDASNIIESQIIQKKDGRLIFNIVRNKNFCIDDEKVLEKLIFERLPEEICRIEYVESIKRNASGKFQFIVNELIDPINASGEYNLNSINSDDWEV